MSSTVISPYSILVKAFRLYFTNPLKISSIYLLTVIPSLFFSFSLFNTFSNISQDFSLPKITILILLVLILMYTECLAHISIVYIYSHKKISPLKAMLRNWKINMVYTAQILLITILTIVTAPTLVLPFIISPLILLQAPIALSQTGTSPIQNLKNTWNLVKTNKIFFYKSFAVLAILIFGWASLLDFVKDIFWLSTILGLVSSLTLVPITITFGYCLFKELKNERHN